MKVGLIGVGYWGPNLLRTFSSVPECKVTRVADLSQERLRAVKDKYPDVALTTRFDDVIGSDVDAVIIATPVWTHHEIAKKALNKGKHVLVEKPIASNTAQAEDLIEVARKNDRVLMVDHTWVYDGAIRKMKEVVSSGRLGKLYSFESSRANLGKLQPDINVVWDLAIHDFSIMSYLFQSTPKWISSVGVCPVSWGESPLECIAYVTVGLENGVTAHIHVSWLSAEKVRRITVSGDRQMMVYNQLEPQPIKVYNKTVTAKAGEHARAVTFHYTDDNAFDAPEVDKTETLQVMGRHFVDCIANNRNPITDGMEGLRIVRLLEATDKALKNAEQTRLSVGG